MAVAGFAALVLMRDNLHKSLDDWGPQNRLTALNLPT